VKRFVDISFAIIGFVVFSPLWVLIPLLIKWEDGGAVFFLQRRVGRFKRPFYIYKFRTMREGNVTRIGRWLRRTGLDELPQFINILKGDMSIVGPRALMFDDVVRLGWDSRYYIRRWHVKPGITGLGQLYAGRSAHHSWLFDKTYLKQRSAMLDIRIVALSFIMNVFGKAPVRAWLYRRSIARQRNCGNWRRWETLFDARKNRALPKQIEDYTQYPWASPLAHSLAVFQLGESGGGTIVQQTRKSRIEGIDPAFCRAMGLFVNEEHRHADILSLCVQSLGGRLIQNNWTARLFVVGRRLMGLRLKVLVLLAAEVVGICYYKLLALRLPHGQLRSLLEELAQDEEAHLQFHSAFLRMSTPGVMRGLVFKMMWRLVTFCAAVVVSIDHRHGLRALNISLVQVWRRWMYLVRETEAQVISRRPDYYFLRKVNLDYT
jgi:lipopolysaccharide/colanic/teichoic acid biosynthesis glycosyltransferase